MLFHGVLLLAAYCFAQHAIANNIEFKYNNACTQQQRDQVTLGWKEAVIIGRAAAKSMRRKPPYDTSDLATRYFGSNAGADTGLGFDVARKYINFIKCLQTHWIHIPLTMLHYRNI